MDDNSRKLNCFKPFLLQGFHFSKLNGAIDKGWESPFNNNFADSNGQDWTYEKRQLLEDTVHSACFVALVIKN